MNKYEMTGKVVKIGEIQVFSSGFQKRDIVIAEQGGQYEHRLAWELKKDNISKVKGIKVGDMVTISGYPESREYNGKYFTSFSATFLKKAEKDASVPEPVEADAVDYEEVEEEMPF